MIPINDLLKDERTKTVYKMYEPLEKGFAEVAKNRGGPLKINYELHGTGPIKLVFIMGLRAPLIAWDRQIKFFGNDHGDKYTVLVFDNRGVGSSDKPIMRYSTSEMAEDVVDLMAHVNWPTEGRKIHVVGVSMGGMIAQELAYKIPERIASLTLQSTAAFMTRDNLVSIRTHSGLLYSYAKHDALAWAGFLRIFEPFALTSVPMIKSLLAHLRRRYEIIRPKSFEERLAVTRGNLFTNEYLDAPDDIFPSKADRFNAEEVWRSINVVQPSFLSFIAQAIAAGWHYFGPERLKVLKEKIECILVCTGTEDKMIGVSHSRYLAEELKPVCEVREFFAGHAINIELENIYNDMIMDFVDRAAAKYS